MITPPIAGPMARVILVLKVFKVTELGSCSMGEKVGTLADQAGRIIALPIPNKKTNNSNK